MTGKFRHPEAFLAKADARTVGELIAASADVALIIGGDGVVHDLAFRLADPAGLGLAQWRGRPVEELVSERCRPKLRKLIELARRGQPSGEVEVLHATPAQEDFPVRYAALPLEPEGQVVLVGRDQRSLVALQSRLLANREEMASSSKQKRQAETHYRLLFELGSDALIVVEAASGRVREINPQAAQLFGRLPRELVGKPLATLFDKASRADIQALLGSVVSTAQASTTDARTAEGDLAMTLSADLFRADDLRLVLIRLIADAGSSEPPVTNEANLLGLMRGAVEGIVLTDATGAIVWANDTFMNLTQVADLSHIRGQSLDTFLERGSVELNLLLSQLSQAGRVQPLALDMVGTHGQHSAVELSGIAMPDGSPPGYGFVLRSSAAVRPRTGDLPQSTADMIDMIGKVPLKGVVRDTTDLIERACIEAALKLTGDNRAAAAKVLGLSRQSLYVKLRRYGLSDDSDSAGDD